MRIDDFLKKVASDMKVNSCIFSRDDFYYILKYLGIKKDTSLATDIEKFYNDFLESLDNSLVKYITKKVKDKENTTHYLGLYVDKKANYLNAIKVYFPVKYEYMISALKTVFIYLVRNNVECTVKFHEKATNENIVIRFYHQEDVLPFINYCSSNFALNDLLVNTNPFMAKIKGFGIIKDDNSISTFNQALSILLEIYFNNIASLSLYDRVSELDFLNFIINISEKENDPSMLFNIKEIENSIKAILLNTSPLVIDI